MIEDYYSAKKLGDEAVRYAIKNGKSPYLPVLDALDEVDNSLREEKLGLMELPLNRIIGNKELGRTNAFANNFMPILDGGSEFSVKWSNVYDYYKRKEANELFDAFNISGKYNGKKFLMIDLTIKNNYLENKYIVKKYNYEILETIDTIQKIFSIDTAYIAVNNQIIQNLLEEYSGIYPNIKFVSRVINNEYSVSYNGYDIIKIYNVLKFNRYYNTKYFTVVSKKETIVVKTKPNILVSELLMFLNLEGNINIITYSNEKMNNYDGILSESIKTIVVN